MTDRAEHSMWRDVHPALSPAEEKSWRLAKLRSMPLAELERIHAEQARSLRSGRIELSAVIARWVEIHDITDRLALTIQEIEQVLIERRGEKS